jgi:isopenicillin-N N-acyltransferase like protein
MERNAMGFFPIVDLRGAPHEMGRAHGRSLGDAVRRNYDIYMRTVQLMAGLAEGEILDRAAHLRPSVEQAAPHLLEEMKGIAEGAGVSLDAVMVINARTELMFGETLLGECTSVAMRRERCATGGPLLAQNWDWKPQIRSGGVILRMEPAGGCRILVCCEAGQVGKIGINERGLGVGLNALRTGKRQLGVPIHVLLRMVLETGGVEEAVALVRRSRPASASHFMLADSGDRIVGLEVSPQGVARIEPKDGVVVHTNHFLDGVLAIHDTNLTDVPDSPVRLERALELLGSRHLWSAEDLKPIFRDHSGAPGSICRHMNPQDPEPLRAETLGGFIFDLGSLSAEVAWGQPCSHPYRSMSL